MRDLKFKVYGPDGERVFSKPFTIRELPKLMARNWNYAQYTGLKDKYEKEIYEGDILREKFSEQSEEPDRLYAVVWGDDGWYLVLQEESWDINEAMDLAPEEQPRMVYFYERMDIVGNIYEK
jgi:uncharacterized phage protein (TIGR01671 family)